MSRPLSQDRLIRSYVDLVRKHTDDLHGAEFGVYSHTLGDGLPPLSFDYSDNRTVCSSVVLNYDNKWTFVSNSKSGIKDSVVNMYCSRDLQFIHPPPPRGGGAGGGGVV